MIFDTTPTTGLYDEALRKSAVKMARTRLQNQLIVYFTTLTNEDTDPQHVINLAQQAMDAVDEIYKGYPPLATLAAE